MLLRGADSGEPDGDCVLELLLLTVPWSTVSKSPLSACTGDTRRRDAPGEPTFAAQRGFP